MIRLAVFASVACLFCGGAAACVGENQGPGTASDLDAGTGADGSLGTDGGTLPPQKLVWVHGATGAPISVVDGADKRCEDELRTARPGGRAFAWVVRGGVSPVSRLGTTEGPWHSPTGRVIFPTRQSLLESRLSNGLEEEFRGTRTDGRVWTGLLPDGGPSGFDCSDWKEIANDAGATVGLLGSTDGTWVTSPTREACTSNRALVICLEN